jgi:hypothetical protein
MSLVWREVYFGNAQAPGGLLAGRHDDLPTSRGDAVGAVVSAGMSRLNSASTDYALQQRREQVEPTAEIMMQGHERGGMLAVATYDNVRYGELVGQRVDNIELVNGIYARPRDAHYQWSNRARINGVAGTASYRFFWITRH